MGILFKDYNKAGPGVAKGPKKNGFVLFFEIYFSKFWKLIQLNLLYLICCIPIVTFGPATAALTKVLKNYSQERHAFLYSDFFEAFRKNFKQSFFIGLIDVVLIVAFYFSIPYYAGVAMGKSSFTILFSISLCIMLTIIMMHFFIYLMIVSTTLKLSDILKNSLILAISEMKKNAITLLIAIAVIAPLYLFFPYSIFVIPFFPFSFLGLVICFNSYPIVRKVVIQPFYDKKGELNPEYKYLYPDLDDDDTIPEEGSPQNT